VPHRNTILQLSAPYTNHVSSESPPFEPYTLVPSGEYIKTHCKQANRQISLNSHRQHPARTAFPDNAVRSAFSQQHLAYLFTYYTYVAHHLKRWKHYSTEKTCLSVSAWSAWKCQFYTLHELPQGYSSEPSIQPQIQTNGWMSRAESLLWGRPELITTDDCVLSVSDWCAL